MRRMSDVLVGWSAPAALLCLLGLIAVVSIPSFAADEPAAGSAAAATGAEAWPDPPGEILFVGKNKIATANSRFHRWRVARADFSPDNLEQGEIFIEVDVASLDTGIEQRDKHLRTDEFFDVAKYPTATIRVHGAEPIEENRYRAQMDFNIRGVEKTLPVEFDVVSREPLKVQGEVILNREDFAVGKEHNKFNPMSIEPEIPIRFTAQLEPTS